MRMERNLFLQQREHVFHPDIRPEIASVFSRLFFSVFIINGVLNTFSQQIRVAHPGLKAVSGPLWILAKAAFYGRLSFQHHLLRNFSLEFNDTADAAHHAVASRADTG